MRGRSSDSVKIYYPRFRKDELIRILRGRVRELEELLPVKLVILFGSYAEGRQTAASDIDLLIVYKGPRRDDTYSVCWNVLKIPDLELHIYSEGEYEKVKDFMKTASRGIIITSKR